MLILPMKVVLIKVNNYNKIQNMCNHSNYVICLESTTFYGTLAHLQFISPTPSNEDATVDQTEKDGMQEKVG